MFGTLISDFTIYTPLFCKIQQCQGYGINIKILTCAGGFK